MICKYCGKEFDHSGFKEYCSSRCYHRDKDGRADKPTICKCCGKEFIPKYGNERYCSDECKRRSINKSKHRYYKKLNPTKERELFTHTCIVCENTYQTTAQNSKYCSDACKYRGRYLETIKKKYGSVEAYNNLLQKKQEDVAEKRTLHLKEIAEERALRIQLRAEKKRPKKKPTVHGECIVCGATFTTFNPKQRTCSKECSKRLAHSKKHHRIPKEQIIDKDITLEGLYRRDSGVCYLCGGRCDWGDRDPDRNIVGPNYPSIDHVIPISRGGLHAWGNVRLSHFYCNTLKSDKLTVLKGFKEKSAEPVENAMI